jgi:hypothetical protein
MVGRVELIVPSQNYGVITDEHRQRFVFWRASVADGQFDGLARTRGGDLRAAGYGRWRNRGDGPTGRGRASVNRLAREADATSRPDDDARLREILEAVGSTPSQLGALLYDYYRDKARADRSSRELLYLHLGIAIGALRRR